MQVIERTRFDVEARGIEPCLTRVAAQGRRPLEIIRLDVDQQ